MKLNKTSVFIYSAILSLSVGSAQASIEFDKPAEPKAKLIKATKSATKKVKETIVQDTPEKTTEQTDVIILKDIKTSGMEHTDGSTVLKLIGMEIGGNKTYEYNMANNKVLEQKLLGTGFFQSAKVSKTDNNELMFTVKENPTYETIKVNGGKLIKNKEITQILKQLGVQEGKTFSPVTLKIFENQIKEQYTTIGKQKAQLNVTPTDTANGGVDLVVNVDEGDTTKINHISFVGNEKFTEKELYRKMKLDNKGMIFSDRLNQEKLRADLENIVNYYHDNGYFEAQTQDVKFADSAKPNYQDVTIYLHEGNIYNFGKPQVIMPSQLQQDLFADGESLNKLVTVKEGEVYNRSEVAKTLTNLQNYLYSHGYAFNKIDVEPVANGNTVSFNFKVVPNQKVKVNDVIISGNEKTKNYVIAREMRQQKGEIYDLNKMQRTKERLDLTGFFNEVEMKTVPHVENGQVSEDLADININVKERRTGTLQASVGYQQESKMNVGLSAEDINFKGTGNTVGAGVNWAKSQQNANIHFYNPYFTKSGISLDTRIYGNVYDPRKRSSNHQSYKTSRYGAAFNFGIPVGEYDKIYTGLDIQHMKVNTYENAPKQYREFMQAETDSTTGVGKFSGMLYKGTIGWGRNKTNHAYFPTKGYSISTNGEVTLPGSKLRYYKAEANNRLFFPIGKESTIMLGAHLGYANSYGKTKQLPFFENYYGGGIGSVRGFEGSTLGPKVYDRDGSLITYGGNKMFTTTLEYITPVPFIKDSSNARISAFIDAGSVWDGKSYTAADSDNGYSVYKAKTHKSTFGNEFRASAGVAWTWLSPMGPVKFSYAAPLRKKSEDQLERFQFSIGTVF